MAKGIVKWFNARRATASSPLKGAADLFVHHTAIQAKVSAPCRKTSRSPSSHPGPEGSQAPTWSKSSKGSSAPPGALAWKEP